MIATTTEITISALTSYAYAPIFALFVYMIFKLIAHFRW